MCRRVLKLELRSNAPRSPGSRIKRASCPAVRRVQYFETRRVWTQTKPKRPAVFGAYDTCAWRVYFRRWSRAYTRSFFWSPIARVQQLSATESVTAVRYGRSGTVYASLLNYNNYSIAASIEESRKKKKSAQRAKKKKKKQLNTITLLLIYSWIRVVVHWACVHAHHTPRIL